MNGFAKAAALSNVVAVLAIGLAAPASAPAAIIEPPRAPHAVTVLPDRDAVTAEGFGAGQRLTVRVVRGGATIGTAEGIAGADGALQVNDGGGACWIGSVPDIAVRDRVVVAPAGSPLDSGEATTTADVQTDLPVDDALGNVVVSGTARAPDGRPLDPALLEARIVNPDFKTLGLAGRDIRATAGRGSRGGTLSYDPVATNPDGTHWTAVFSGLDAAQRRAALAGETRLLAWEAADAAGNRLGLTIRIAGAARAGGLAACAAVAPDPVPTPAPPGGGSVDPGTSGLPVPAGAAAAVAAAHDSGARTAAVALPAQGQALAAIAATAPRVVADPAVAVRISAARVRTQGLALMVRLPRGTHWCRVAVHRMRGGRPAAKPVAVIWHKVPHNGGAYRLHVRDATLTSRLSPGPYLVEVTPATSRTRLGTPMRMTIVVTP